jgi:hypothetical protein
MSDDLPKILDRLVGNKTPLIGVKAHQRIAEVNDSNRCNALLNEGRWLGRLPRFWRREPFQTWQVPGCLLHEYNAEDIGTCIGNKRIVVVGDSGVRQIFFAMVRKLDPEDVDDLGNMAPKKGNIRYKSRSTDVELQFIWDPFLNTSSLYQELDILSTAQSSQSSQSSQSMPNKSRPASDIIVIGGGMHFARQFDANAADRYESAIESIVLHSRESQADSTTWLFKERTEVFLLPVEEPVYSLLSPARQRAIQPEEIEDMNDRLHKLPVDVPIKVPWNFQSMSMGRRIAFGESGMHVVASIVNHRADVLLNLHCNAKTRRYHGTCCHGSPAPGLVNILCLGAIAALAMLQLSVKLLATKAGPSSNLGSLSILAVALLYCFMADRTLMFSKVHILFDKQDLLWLSGLITATGALSWRRRPSINSQYLLPTTSTATDGFLTREHTEEWKGWMQAALLAYHWTGVSKLLPAYEVVRLLLASYLFLTGYGHTMFFLTKADFSLRRLCIVLIRLNILPICLSLLMGTSYSSYYFSPLISFWFLVVFLTLRIGQGRNENIAFLGLKILLSAAALTVFWTSGFVKSSVHMLNAVLRTSWSEDGWQFRIATDPYIVYVGMAVGATKVFLQKDAPLYSRRSVYPLN